MSPQIDDGDLLQTEGFEIGFDSGSELIGPLRAMPLALIVSRCSDLGDDHQVIRIGRERLSQ